MRKCNVRIEDQHFHELHHALGCPWPDEIMGETYRNHFATDADSDNEKGWLLWNDGWGHIEGHDYHSFVAVCPTWIMFGK
ncbi:hypothetical protein [Chachezhania sediminis]|uniref:hypothetical protein n=1 Tax=Chachezhania sediminis TaxID=2599291 RepID=UPI00131EAB5A|nr:hypothetical protein [Chachezhania sediminis]